VTHTLSHTDRQSTQGKYMIYFFLFIFSIIFITQPWEKTTQKNLPSFAIVSPNFHR
jgi:hypothetical protein